MRRSRLVDPSGAYSRVSVLISIASRLLRVLGGWGVEY